MSSLLHVCSFFVPSLLLLVSFWFLQYRFHCIFLFLILLPFFCYSPTSHLHPPSTHSSSCPMASTTTAPPAPLTSTATGGAWGQPLPSPSFRPHHHPPPPPPAPPAHGHAPPQLCYQTTLLTARWGPWFHHQKCPAGRFVCSPESTSHPSNAKGLFFCRTHVV